MHLGFQLDRSLGGFPVFVVKPMENLGFCPPDWGHFGVHFGVHLGARFGVRLGSILGSILGPFLSPFWVYFAIDCLCDGITSYHIRSREE